MKTLLLTLFSLLTLFPVDLEKRTFLNDRVELLIPKEFKQMDAAMLDLKYRGQNRPTLVMTDEDGTVNVALNLTTNPASEKVIEAYTTSLKQNFQKALPDAVWKSDGVTIINGRKVGHLKLITDAIDQKIYNSIFITHCDGKLLIGTFNCTEKLLPKWEETAEQIVQSLKVK